MSTNAHFVKLLLAEGEDKRGCIQAPTPKPTYGAWSYRAACEHPMSTEWHGQSKKNRGDSPPPPLPELSRAWMAPEETEEEAEESPRMIEEVAEHAERGP